jgi:hypothetical protein
MKSFVLMNFKFISYLFKKDTFESLIMSKFLTDSLIWSKNVMA